MESKEEIEKMCHEVADELFGRMTIEQLENFMNSNEMELSGCENDAEIQARNDIMADLERILDEKKKNK